MKFDAKISRNERGWKWLLSQNSAKVYHNKNVIPDLTYDNKVIFQTNIKI